MEKGQSVCYMSSSQKDFVRAIKKCAGVKKEEHIWLFENPEGFIEAFNGEFGNLKPLMCVNDFEMFPKCGIESEDYIGINTAWGKYWNNKVGDNYGNLKLVYYPPEEGMNNSYETYLEGFLRYWNEKKEFLLKTGDQEAVQKIDAIITAFKAQFLNLEEIETQSKW